MRIIGPAQPDETDEQYLKRIVDAAPPLTPELAARLAALLPLPSRAVSKSGGDDDG
jgi:hypothetical protein